MRIDVSLPRSWEELTQPQLRRLFEVIVEVQSRSQSLRFADAEDFAAQTAAQVAARLFIEWGGFEVLCAAADGVILRTPDRSSFVLDTATLSAAAAQLLWVGSLPASPVRLEVIDCSMACPADLSERFSFDDWLACESFWQAYQLSQDSQWLRSMASILYHDDDIKLSEAETLSIFYWWASVKTMVSEMFPNFFKPAPADDAPAAPSHDDLRRNMDAQIRALTRGDITKEERVLSLNALRALTELDAQAREFDDLNKKYPKK